MAARRGKIHFGVIAGVLIVLAIAAAMAALATWDTTGRSGDGLSSDFTYSIGDLATVDPELIGWSEQGGFATGLDTMYAIATDLQGRVYVSGDREVRVFAADGSPAGVIASASPVYGLATDWQDNLAAVRANWVGIYNPRHDLTASWRIPDEGVRLTAVAMDDENVFVADGGNRIVLRFDREGTEIGRFGARDAVREHPGFAVPSPNFDLVMGRDRLLRIVNPGRGWVEYWTGRGDRERHWGRMSAAIEGFAPCCNPVHITLLPGGGLITSEKGLVRIKEYDQDGNLLSVVASPEQLLGSELAASGNNAVFDIATDAAGRVLVLDPIQKRVRIFTKNEVEQ